LRRDSWSPRRAVALGAATGGTARVLVGGLNGLDPLGAALALGAAVVYAAYILGCAGQLERTDPLLLTALVTTSAAVTVAGTGAVKGELSLDLGVSAFRCGSSTIFPTRPSARASIARRSAPRPRWSWPCARSARGPTGSARGPVILGYPLAAPAEIAIA
jgi:drug/metabolite transporter (DMT)-like permease